MYPDYPAERARLRRVRENEHLAARRHPHRWLGQLETGRRAVSARPVQGLGCSAEMTSRTRTIPRTSPGAAVSTSTSTGLCSAAAAAPCARAEPLWICLLY